MNTQHLSDSALLSETQRLCALERKTTLEILHLLREIEARALFAKTHSSLFEFCTKTLGFSEDQAHRRISSMRLLKSVPAVEAQVADGSLKISQLAQVQTFIRAEKKETGRVVSAQETQALLDSLAGKSSRETERVLLEKSPALQARRQTEEKIRPVTPTHTEVRFVADADLMRLFEEAKGLLAHGGNLNPPMQEVFKRVLRDWVARQQATRTGSTRPNPLVSPATSKVNAATSMALPSTRYTSAPKNEGSTRVRRASASTVAPVACAVLLNTLWNFITEYPLAAVAQTWRPTFSSIAGCTTKPRADGILDRGPELSRALT